jgi:hypothetical protein
MNKGVVYIVSDNIEEASEFCRQWSPFDQSTEKEQKYCVGVGLLQLSEVLRGWRHFGHSHE